MNWFKKKNTKTSDLLYFTIRGSSTWMTTMTNWTRQMLFSPQCSKTCGRGSRRRESYCMNNLGRRLVDRECNEYQRGDTEACNEQLCPKWTVSEWSEVGMLHTHFTYPTDHTHHYRSYSSKGKSTSKLYTSTVLRCFPSVLFSRNGRNRVEMESCCQHILTF